MGSTSQPSELSTVAGGGGGGVGSLDQQPNATPGAVPAPIGAPPQSGTHALHQTGRNKCHSYASVAKLHGEATCDTRSFFETLATAGQIAWHCHLYSAFYVAQSFDSVSGICS